MLIEESISSSSILHKTLINEGYQVLVSGGFQDDTFKKASDINPDLIVVNVESPDKELLSQMKLINDTYPKPIIIFSEQGDSKMIDSAVQAGVSAFIVDGLTANRIKPVLEVALARFNNYSSLRHELAKTKEDLANRKIVEKAKGIIMKQRHCPEDEAYQLLRKLAMDRNQKIVDVANNVIEVSSLLM